MCVCLKDVWFHSPFILLIGNCNFYFVCFVQIIVIILRYVTRAKAILISDFIAQLPNTHWFNWHLYFVVENFCDWIDTIHQILNRYVLGILTQANTYIHTHCCKVKVQNQINIFYNECPKIWIFMQFYCQLYRALYSFKIKMKKILLE